MSLLQDLKLPQLAPKLPVPVLDSHTHLDITTRNSGLQVDQALELAQMVNVAGVVQVGCSVTSAPAAVQLAHQYSQIVAAVAIHPNDAAEAETKDSLDSALEMIAQLAKDERVCAVGETGLDYYRTRDAESQKIQHKAFAAHIQIAHQTKRTLVIHDRDAHDDVLRILDAEGWPERVVMHCFSGDAELAQKCLQHGAWLSFAGNVTYNSNRHLREALAIVPKDKILVETDAPYLTPIPERGKSNSSYLMPHTVRFMAEFLKLDLADLCNQLYQNCETAMGGSWL